jgi:1,2-diacylglycerol 3-beta-galactosyltransferase
VVDNGVGEYSPDPAQIAAIVTRWFGPERDELPLRAARARELGHPQATFDIVRSTVSLLDAYPHAAFR